MSLLLLKTATIKDPPTRPRGRWGVRKLVYLVRKGEKHDLAWWQQWLADHWDD